MARPEDMLFKFFKDASPTFNLAKDYSGAGAEDVSLAPAAGEIWEVNRIIVELRASTALVAAGWGSGAALTNGLTLKVFAGASEKLDLLDGHTIKANGDWGGLCFDVLGLGSVNPAVTTYLHARWTFGKTGAPITLQGNLGHKLVLGLSDDLSDSGDVTHFHVQLQGVKKVTNVP